MLVFNKKGQPILEAEARIPYEVALGSTWYRFLEGLKNEKIFGTRCPKCRRVLVAARTFCPRCFVEMGEWVEVSHVGKLIAWALTDYEFFNMPTKPPFISAFIHLEGADSNFLHFLGGFGLQDMDAIRRNVKNGMKVKAVWREHKTGSILDIKYFEPV
jgi:uncharacterized OB-fold protein